MNERTIKLLLWLINAVLIACTVGAITWAARGPQYELGSDDRIQMIRAANANNQKKQLQNNEPALIELERLWKKDLRPVELFPPDYVPEEDNGQKPDQGMTTRSQPPTKPLKVKLLATAIESDDAYAIFEDDEHKIEVVHEGGEIDGAVVVKIWPNGVKLDHEGQEVNLILQNDYNGAISPPIPSPSSTSSPARPSYRRPPQRRPK